MGTDRGRDAELLVASVDDPDRFGELFDRNVEMMLAFFVRRTGCAQTAADLTSETFAQAFASRQRYAPTGAPAQAWLFTIARRQLSRYARREAVSTKYRRRLGVGLGPVGDDDLDRIEALVDFAPQRAAIREALEELPDGRAEAVWLRVGHDLSYAEVARRLDCSEQAARARVTRGLSQLADLLEAP